MDAAFSGCPKGNPDNCHWSQEGFPVLFELASDVRSSHARCNMRDARCKIDACSLHDLIVQFRRISRAFVDISIEAVEWLGRDCTSPKELITEDHIFQANIEPL